MKFFIWPFFLCMVSITLYGQRQFEEGVQILGIQSIERFKSFLSLANDASNGDEIQANIRWVKQELSTQGFEVKLLETSSLPLMIANLVVKEKLPTIAFYMHLDGQAVDGSKWNQNNPYQAVLKQETSTSFKTVPWKALKKTNNYDDLRIFARSSSDDKGPFAMFLTALDYLKIKNKQPAFNLKLILDFEEEQSSPGLPELVKTHKEDLLAELLLIFDGPMHGSGRPTLVFGNRGIATLTLTTYGPLTAQHSGHYGNFIPNPALALTKVLASMKDNNGRVT
ncbi:MAG: M20/M25/M40 family metallo-hydrolase, partial [Flavobacteriaceae bacterium]